VGVWLVRCETSLSIDNDLGRFVCGLAARQTKRGCRYVQDPVGETELARSLSSPEGRTYAAAIAEYPSDRQAGIGQVSADRVGCTDKGVFGRGLF